MEEPNPIAKYNQNFDEPKREVLELLRVHLDKIIGQGNSRLWHGSPVWFVGENPVAGYSVNSRGVSLLFWNGQNFDNFELHKVGKFFAAEKRYHRAQDVDLKELKALLRLSKELVWDSVSFIRSQKTKAQSK